MPVIMLSVVLALLPAPAQAGASCTATPFGETCREPSVPKPAARCVSTPFGETCSEPPAAAAAPEVKRASGVNGEAGPLSANAAKGAKR